MSITSFVRLPTPSLGTPAAGSSFGLSPPVPSASTARPLAIRSTPANSLASTDGWRSGAIAAAGPTTMRSVAHAIAVVIDTASHTGRCIIRCSPQNTPS